MRSLSLGTRNLPGRGPRHSLALGNAELARPLHRRNAALEKPTFKTDDAKPDDAKKDATKPADL